MRIVHGCVVSDVDTEFGHFEVSTNPNGETVAFHDNGSQVDFGRDDRHFLIANWMLTEFRGMPEGKTWVMAPYLDDDTEMGI